MHRGKSHEDHVLGGTFRGSRGLQLVFANSTWANRVFANGTRPGVPLFGGFRPLSFSHSPRNIHASITNRSPRAFIHLRQTVLLRSIITYTPSTGQVLMPRIFSFSFKRFLSPLSKEVDVLLSPKDAGATRRKARRHRLYRCGITAFQQRTCK
jgi:hypothetical protein